MWTLILTIVTFTGGVDINSIDGFSDYEKCNKAAQAWHKSRPTATVYESKFISSMVCIKKSQG